MDRKSLRGSLLLLLGSVIWGAAFVAQRVGMDHLGPFSFNGIRMLLAGIVLIPVAAFIDRKKEPGVRPDPKDQRKAGLLCGALLFIASSLQQMGLVTTSAGKAGFITALYILIVPILNRVLFKKRSGLHVWLAIAIGVFGMYLLCMKEGFRLTRGDTLVCCCAVVFSGHILCCDHFSRRADPVYLAAVQFVTVALASGVIALIVEEPSAAQLKAAAIPILWCGVMSGGVGYTLQMVAQRMTDPTVASLLMSLESVFAALAGALLLHERMSARELLGSVILFAAIVLVQLPAPGRRRVKTSE
jgi:drug/metabolite transporter (DMT)-like permease